MDRRLGLVSVMVAALASACADDGAGDTDGSVVPDSDYCAGVADVDPAWASLEDQVLALVNDARAEARDCGGSSHPAAPALTMAPELRCAARVHTHDMIAGDYFSHDNPAGEGPSDRVERAGYEWSAVGENIAAGEATAEATVQQWLESPGHCANIMGATYTELGVGYGQGSSYGHVWTQVFGARL